MGRKNRKGRSGGQHPRRFYRPKGGRPGSGRGGAAAGEDAIAAWPEPAVAPVSEAPAPTPTCGRCAEWTPAGRAARRAVGRDVPAPGQRDQLSAGGDAGLRLLPLARFH